jgi:hypothetical protein
VYADPEYLNQTMIDNIKESNYELSVVITTEHNNIHVSTSRPTMNPYYSHLRTLLNRVGAKKKIILISAVYDDDLDGPPMPNVHKIWLPYNAMTQDKRLYSSCEPVRFKNFGSKTHWVSFTRNPRHHRFMMAMVLLGFGLGDKTNPNNTGRLHIDSSKVQDYRQWEGFWNNDTSSIAEHRKRHLQLGFDKLRAGAHGGQPDLPQLKSLHYPGMYSRSLKYHYTDSLIEFVNATTFYNHAGSTYCEKINHVLLGMNFPLFVGNRNMVHGMRLMGFDVFDDVLDHGYDSIADPIERLFNIVELNKEILINRDLAQSLWVKCFPRMLENLDKFYNMETNMIDMVEKDLKLYVQEKFHK